MKELTPLVKVTAKYGIIAGLLGTVLTITLYYIGRHPFLIPIFFDFRIILFCVFIYFSLREFRDSYHAGILYFWQGMIGSFVLVSVFAFSASLLILVFEMVVPDFLDSYIRLSVEQIKALPEEIVKRIGKDVIERNLERLPSTNAVELPKLYLFQSFVLGLFISIILSVILRRQPKT